MSTPTTQGEKGLEEFLREVRESQLIHGWDLFNKCREHLHSLAAMKLSPYFSRFEEEVLQWEVKLVETATLFDLWIDMQRRWVHLDGIFESTDVKSADLKCLLPTQTKEFVSKSTELLALMRKLAEKMRKISEWMGWLSGNSRECQVNIEGQTVSFGCDMLRIK